ncbi:Small heat shock protein HSP [Parasponia andersonii]|uniref:Small heat shock protein HSP n=1 Tax=Parasponia andersonii TaxID=3476 RepID=A0A2P5BK14_PARAD|nr:Small heat shock protein HSP [Parasponia andersonii]
MAAHIKRSYEDFEPFCQWKRGQGRDILEVHLQGFSKEHLRVQLNNYGILTISGEQSVDNVKMSRFRKEIKVSKDCKMDQIRAKFTRGILYITLPKVSSESSAGPAEKSQQKESDHKDKTPNNGDQNGISCGGESKRCHSSRRNIALGVAVVVAVGIIVGGFLIWNITSKPAPIIY